VVLTSLSLVRLNNCNDRDVRGGHDNRDSYDNCEDREDRDNHDDNVITINSCAKPAGLLTVPAVKDTNQTELLN
jgi:hypothetical protein